MAGSFTMIPSKEKLGRFIKTLDHYNERFSFLLSKIDNHEGKHRFPSQPYAIIGHYLTILSFIDEKQDFTDDYDGKLNYLIDQLSTYIYVNSSFESLLYADLLFLIEEMNQYLEDSYKEMDMGEIDYSDALLTLEDHVLDNRDSFEYIRLGLEYTSHFPISDQVTNELFSFDEKLQKTLAMLKRENNYSAPNYFVYSNKITKRFWWRPSKN
jgi:hypothetical protein